MLLFRLKCHTWQYVLLNRRMLSFCFKLGYFYQQSDYYLRSIDYLWRHICGELPKTTAAGNRAAAIFCVQDNHKWNVFFFIWREVFCNGVLVTTCQRLSWFMYSSMSCSWQIWARLAWSYLQFGFFACGIKFYCVAKPSRVSTGQEYELVRIKVMIFWLKLGIF